MSTTLVVLFNQPDLHGQSLMKRRSVELNLIIIIRSQLCTKRLILTSSGAWYSITMKDQNEEMDDFRILEDLVQCI